MKISAVDYWLIRFCALARPLLCHLSAYESRLLGDRLRNISIERPVFVSGLARCGSTVLLELLAALPVVATHRYRDFPCWQLPYWWNTYLDRMPVHTVPIERPHQDGIMITRDSPEAMEEPLWMAWFPELHGQKSLHFLTASPPHPAFQRFYREHVGKLLLVRGGTRYVAKNNYQLPRAEFVWSMFPDAEFIIPIRHPLTHVPSLVRQHERFVGYASQEPRLADYLRAAGHYEFGPQRIPIRLDHLDSQRILASWSTGDHLRGYAIQWKQLYALVQHLQQSPQADRVHVVRHEDMCHAPDAVFQRLLEQVGLLPTKAMELPSLAHITRPRTNFDLTAEQREVIWQEVHEVAEKFGYTVDVDC